MNPQKKSIHLCRSTYPIPIYTLSSSTGICRAISFFLQCSVPQQGMIICQPAPISHSVPATSQGLASTLFCTLLMPKRMLVVKNLHTNVGSIRDSDSVPELGRSPGGGHGNPLQNSCLENPMDRGAYKTTVHRVTKSQIWLKWLSMHEVKEKRKSSCFRCCCILEMRSKTVHDMVQEIWAEKKPLQFLYWKWRLHFLGSSVHSSKAPQRVPKSLIWCGESDCQIPVLTHITCPPRLLEESCWRRFKTWSSVKARYLLLSAFQG